MVHVYEPRSEIRGPYSPTRRVSGGCLEPVTLKEIIAALGFPEKQRSRSGPNACLSWLCDPGSGDRYLLVPGDWHGSPFRVRETRLISAAHPVMEDLRDRCGETVLFYAPSHRRNEAAREMCQPSGSALRHRT